MHQQSPGRNRLAQQCVSYWFMLLLVTAAFIRVGPTIHHWMTGPSHTFTPSSKFIEYAQKRPEQIAQAFEHMTDRPTVEQVLRARGAIVALYSLMPNDHFVRSNAIARIVDQGARGLDAVQHTVYQQMIFAGAAAQDSSIGGDGGVQAACADQRDGGAVCQMDHVMARERSKNSEDFADIFGMFATIFGALVWFYKLSIPFAAVGLWGLVVLRGRTMDDYVREHLGDYIIAVAVWPIALINAFPYWTPWTALRTRMVQKLGEMGANQMPVWQQAFACAAVVVGILFSSLVPVRTANAQQADVRVHGFLDADADHKGGARLNHAWAEIVGPVAPGASIDIVVDPAPHALPLRQAMAAFALSDSSGVRVGQLPTATALMFDSPAGERIGGGAWAAGTFASFFDLGAEGWKRLGDVTARVSVLSGSGPNMADANTDKDGMLGVSWRPGGGANVLEATVQGGQQPNGWRTRALAHARLGLGSWGAFVDLTSAYQRTRGADGWGVSTLMVVPLTTHLESAVAYDALRLPDAHASVEYIGRAQVTVLGFSQSMRAAIMARWSSATGWLGDMRLQFVF